MKNSIKLSVLVFGFVVFILSSCGSKGDPLENIIKNEKNIAAIGKINLQQIIDKGDFWKEFGWIKLFTGKLLDSTEWGMNIFAEKSFVLTANDKGEQEFLITAFNLNSAESFKNKIEEMTSGESEVIGDFTMIYNDLASEDFSIAWNDEMGIAIGGVKDGADSKLKLKEVLNTIKNGNSEPLKQEIAAVLTSDKDMCILAFLDQMNFDKSGMKMTNEAKGYLKNASSLITFNGTKGGIKLEIDGYGIETFMKSKYNVFSDKGVSKDLLEKSLTKEAIGWMSLSMRKDQIKELILVQLKAEKVTDSLSMMATEAITDALGGNMAMSLAMFDDKELTVKAVFNVNDKAKLLALFEKTPGFVSLENGDWKFIPKDLPTTGKVVQSNSNLPAVQNMYLNFEGDMLLVSTDSLEAFNNEVALPESYKNNEAKDLPMSFYMNMNSVLANSDLVPDDLVSIIEAISFAKGSSSIGHTEFIIEFKNKEENGWKQVFKSIGGQVKNFL